MPKKGISVSGEGPKSPLNFMQKRKERISGFYLVRLSLVSYKSIKAFKSAEVEKGESAKEHLHLWV